MKLLGVSASRGHVKAKSLLVPDLTNFPAAPDYDYIIVAPYTTPAMNLILLGAKGIICETGGLTTHAAIIARELNIPCVMNVKEIMKSVKNGQDIELNANLGEVIF